LRRAFSFPGVFYVHLMNDVRDDEEERDPAIVWGKRVGRVLGVAILLALAYNLFTGALF
jgi:hypothetical protein